MTSRIAPSVLILSHLKDRYIPKCAPASCQSLLTQLLVLKLTMKTCKCMNLILR